MTGMDPRRVRTRSALIAAFNHLFLTRRDRVIRVADIVAEAGVGRSTFYEQYGGTDALFLEAVAVPLATVADAAAGEGDPDRLERLLEHFWEQRQRARDMLIGRLGDRVARLLAKQIEARLGDRLLSIPQAIAARMLADAALSPVRSWLLGEASCPPRRLAEAICVTGQAMIAAASVDAAIAA